MPGTKMIVTDTDKLQEVVECKKARNNDVFQEEFEEVSRVD
jgi:hypothetical protein